MANSNSSFIQSKKNISKGVVHTSMKRYLNGRPAIVNILTINPNVANATIKPSYGSYFLNAVNSVKKIVSAEDAIAGINASYFKPDSGVPLGVSIINNEVKTGPLYNRVCFGITHNNTFIMDKVKLSGVITIGDSLKLTLNNINQPVLSNKGFNVFTHQWGMNTPKTKNSFVHIVVNKGKIDYIKQSSVKIPKNGYVIVGPHKFVANKINKHDTAAYNTVLSPMEWEQVQYAISGGPYLIKNGKIFIDKQKFTNSFLWRKEPRTAIGYTKGGTMIFLTVDGRNKGISEGATLPEVSQLMYEQGAYNAMNLDGGTSTQMVIKGAIVNKPGKGIAKVTNALVVLIPH